MSRLCVTGKTYSRGLHAAPEQLCKCLDKFSSFVLFSYMHLECISRTAINMAKSQSTKRKTKEAAIKTRVKDPRKKTKHERSVASAPVSDVTEVKRRKASGDIVKNKSSEDVPTPEKQEGEGAGGEESLSPEERRVLERKLKKIRRKAEKKKLRELGKSEAEESKTSSAQTHALEYLKCWSEKREEWKFQKTRQVWLLQHMYDSDKVSDAHFKVLLSYLEGLCGVARETTVQKAEALVRWGEGPQEAGGKSTDSQKMAQRAREVVQILS